MGTRIELEGIIPQPLSSGNFEDEIYFNGGRIVTPRNIP